MIRWCFAVVVLISVCSLNGGAQSRVLDDVALNTRWILVPNAEHPAGPSHWVVAGAVPVKTVQQNKSSEMVREASRPEILVHTGETVAVVHETESSRLRLDAKALGNATKGGHLRIRLTTGAIVEAVATGPGHVDLVPQLFKRKEP